MSASTAAVAAMSAQRKRLVRHFESASAFTPETAISGSTLPHAGFRILSKLQEQDVIRTAPDGKLYLDRNNWEAYSAYRQARVKVAIMVAIALSLIVVATTYYQTAGHA